MNIWTKAIFPGLASQITMADPGVVQIVGDDVRSLTHSANAKLETPHVVSYNFLHEPLQITAWTKMIASAAFALLLFGFAGTIQGAGQYLKVDYPASSDTNELQTAVTYTLWIPDGVSRLRGIIVHQHGAGTTASKEGSTAAYDLHWQALARKWDCALLGPSYHVQNEKIDLSPGGSELWFDPRRGSEKTFLKAVGEFAAKSGHPEIDSVPWVLWGHSGGGIWADVMTDLHPERVVAVFLRSGAAAMFRKRVFPQPQVPAAAYAIPILANAGVKEKKADGSAGPLEGSQTIFQERSEERRVGKECRARG